MISGAAWGLPDPVGYEAASLNPGQRAEFAAPTVRPEHVDVIRGHPARTLLLGRIVRQQGPD